MLIQNLSKMDFQDKNFAYNYLNLIIIYFFLLATCDKERNFFPHFPVDGFYGWWILLVIPLEFREIKHLPFPMAQPN